MAFKDLVKWIMHVLTHRCEIERSALNSLDIMAVGTTSFLFLFLNKPNQYRSLESSIRNSKQLANIKYRILVAHPAQDQIQALFAIKGIVDSRSKQLVKLCIECLSNVFKANDYVETYRAIKYSTQNQTHERKLLELWTSLKPHQKLTDRTSRQWIDVGFQDIDPATDFRGAGILGLYNLLAYSQTTQGQNCFSTAINKQTQFFFCSAGLFITMLTANLVKNRKLDKVFYNAADQTHISREFQLVYNKLFNSFHEFWLKECPNKTILYFNSNLKLFETKATVNLDFIIRN